MPRSTSRQPSARSAAVEPLRGHPKENRAPAPLGQLASAVSTVGGELSMIALGKKAVPLGTATRRVGVREHRRYSMRCARVSKLGWARAMAEQRSAPAGLLPCHRRHSELVTCACSEF
eukprot:3749192-Prymnesium_polylepis.1